ncbi:hypothetical protein [Rubellicoccus peritrichatus]|uniref:4-vinyl reductase 4VR domain-containing protein n=1 Tax=Rubellicoccus peritrichatus TaxID=3080537 RepID=A0AAQ3L9W7_9BACT|nr:hypothetical protein [Puniceicoccus sp. CR14]WOO41367.1 hypothetical protein RZN69_22335 [Puniceicoccus sp. CR14]
MTTAINPGVNGVYESLGLESFFDESGFSIDLVAGTVANPAQNRVIYLSEDIMRGIYEALLDETGPAWKTILFNCGRIWGERLCGRIDREMNDLCQNKMETLPLTAFLRFIENYFAAHGWGKMEIDISLTEDYGIVRIVMRNSFFAQLLSDVDDYVDPIVAGTLASLFSYISGHELGCLEIASPNKGAENTEFVISSNSRLEAVEEDLEGGASADEIVEKLMA